MNHRALRSQPFTGFGDDPHSSIKFGMVHDRGKVSDWSGGPRLRQHKIALGGVVTQTTGRDPWVLKATLLLDSVEDLEALDHLQGKRATLRYGWGITKRVGGTKEIILNDTYLTLPGTMLVSVDDTNSYISDGRRKATATFERPYVAPPIIAPTPWPDSPPWPYPFGFGEGPFGEEPFGNDPEDI